jgi:hypothetical protein
MRKNLLHFPDSPRYNRQGKIVLRMSLFPPRVSPGAAAHEEFQRGWQLLF